jgi:DNA polymerase epsilon subunit 1
LDLANHLSGKKRTYLRLDFKTVSALLHVRGKLAPQVEKNIAQMKISSAYEGVDWNESSVGIVGIPTADADDTSDWRNDSGRTSRSATGARRDSSGIEFIQDIRECDVPYYMRVSIDLVWLREHLGQRTRLNVNTAPPPPPPPPQSPPSNNRIFV